MKSNIKKLTALALALSTFASVPSAFAANDGHTEVTEASANGSKSLAENVAQFQNLQPGVFFVDPSIETVDPDAANQIIMQITKIFEQYPAIKDEFVRQIQSVNPSARFVIKAFDDDALRLVPTRLCMMERRIRNPRAPQPPVVYDLQDGEFAISVNRQSINMGKAFGFAQDLSEISFATAYAMGHLIDTTICCHEDPTLLPFIVNAHLNKGMFSYFDDPMGELTADALWKMATMTSAEAFKAYNERQKEFADMSDRMLDIAVKNLNEIADKEEAVSGKSLNHVEKLCLVELVLRNNSYGYEPQLTFNCLNNTSFSRRFANGFACEYSGRDSDHTAYSKVLHEWLKSKEASMAASK